MFTGHPLLRNALCEHFSPILKNGNGGDLNPNSQILVTNGALGSLYSAIMNLVGPGDEVLMFEPYYTQYVNHIEFAGASIKTAPMHITKENKWDFDWQAFEDSITDKTKLVVLTNPHNPSGKLFTRDEIAKMTAILDKHPHINVLSDDVYYFLPFDGRKYESFANFNESNFAKTITVYSAGKMLNCTGWKIGWSIGPAQLIKQAMFVHEASTFNCNVTGQIAVAKSLPDAFNLEYKGHKNYLEYTRHTFEKARDEAVKLVKRSNNIKFDPVTCESGYFITADISTTRDLIPDRYFKPNVNYEDDKDTIIPQM